MIQKSPTPAVWRHLLKPRMHPAALWRLGNYFRACYMKPYGIRGPGRDSLLNPISQITCYPWFTGNEIPRSFVFYWHPAPTTEFYPTHVENYGLAPAMARMKPLRSVVVIGSHTRHTVDILPGEDILEGIDFRVVRTHDGEEMTDPVVREYAEALIHKYDGEDTCPLPTNQPFQHGRKS